MQRLIFIGLILAMILGVAVGAFVYGDPGARMNAAAQRVAQFDTNGDQHLSEEEFNASRTGDSDFTFAQVDKNSDSIVRIGLGVVSGAWLRRHSYCWGPPRCTLA